MRLAILLILGIFCQSINAEPLASDAPKIESGKPGKQDPRYSAGEPDYNTEQREQWLKACEKYKNKDLETYKKCFQDEKSKSKEALRQSFEEVERRQSLPMKNVNPLIEEQERNVTGQDEE